MASPARSAVPPLRIAAVNRAPVRGDGGFVVYWMIAARRTRWNFALQRAVEWCRELGRSLVVLEALRVGYPFASDRLHAFALDGMADNATAFARAGVRHHPYVEPAHGEGKGLQEPLAADACVVVTDDFPHFFLPHMVAAAGERLPVLLEAVDSNGLLPLRSAQKAFATAYHFRRFLQKELPEHLYAVPDADPLRPRSSAAGPPHLPGCCAARPRRLPHSPSTTTSRRRGSGAGPRPAKRCCARSSASAWNAIHPTATSRRPKDRAGCLPTCIGDSSPRTMCSTGSRGTRDGHPSGSD